MERRNDGIHLSHHPNALRECEREAGLMVLPARQRRPIRLIHTSGGPICLVQALEPQCLLDGWRCYAILAVGLRGQGVRQLRLYERAGSGPAVTDGPEAA